MTTDVKVLKIDTGEAQKSVKELRAELKALKDTLLNTTKGTEEYNEALRQAADIQHELKEQMEEVNASAMDFGQIVGNCTKAVGGLVGGFQAATAVMNLFGSENEDVIKTLKTMQQLMALTQALPAIDNGIKAFKRLGIAIKASTTALKGFSAASIATGLGAITFALGLLITNWDKVTDAMKRWGIIHEDTKKKLEEEKNKVDEVRKSYAEWQAQMLKEERNEKISNLNEKAKEAYKDLEKQIKQLSKEETDLRYKADLAWRIEGKTAGDVYKKLADDAKTQKELLQQQQTAILENANSYVVLDSKVEKLKESYKALVEEIANWGKSQKQLELDKVTAEEKKRIEIIKATVKDKKLAEEQITAITEHYAKERADIEKKYADIALKKEIQDSIDAIDNSYKLEQAKLQKQYDEKLILEHDYTERKKELLTTYVQDYVDNIQFILDTETSLTDAQILDLTNKINAARALLKTDGKDTPKTDATTDLDGITKAINASALALNDFSDNPAWGNILKNVATLTANWDTLNANIQKGGKEAFSAYAQIAATALGAIANMMNGLAAEQDTSNKEGFESSKKYQIAGATMSMLAGITSAWASSMQLMFPANVIIGSMLSAMMLATGIAQIAKIKNTQFEGNNASTGSSPSTNAVNTVIAPVQYTQDVQGASIEGAIKDSRVYVVESDITNTQDRVRVTESEATY